MLGIGDMVMPGPLLCFDLCCDNYKRQARGDSCGGPGPANISGRMQKVFYFHCTLMGYFVDLLTATVASHIIHQAAQPLILIFCIPWRQCCLPSIFCVYFMFNKIKCGIAWCH
uniref:Uncharacterized protein n=1 Tax=Piliocolobus tephrosceles TaxID=591936 RepID=A0A8C9LVZ7_9PRIM